MSYKRAFGVIVIVMLTMTFSVGLVTAAPASTAITTPTDTATASNTATQAPSETPTATVTLTNTSLPDLVVLSANTAPQGWTGGCAKNLVMGVNVTIKNNGVADAGAFVVDVSGTQQTVSDGLAAGESVTRWFANTGSLLITADATTLIAESNESNNTLSYISVTATPPAICTSTPTQTPSNTPVPPTPTKTATKTPVTITLSSVAAQDGWVLETSETSNVGGTLNNTATTFRLGDDTAKKQYRSVLSFNTSGIPDNATITAVTLKVKQQSIVGGGNPVATLQGFMVELKTGFFGTFTGVQALDFQSNADKTLGPVMATPVSSIYSFNLITGKTFINKLTSNSGLTQIRLRFKLDDDNNAVANYLSLYSGNDLTTANHPQLVITYTVP